MKDDIEMIYYIESINYDECKEWILKKHYAGRMCPITYKFGLFDNNGIIQGIVTFGTHVSSTLRDLWKSKYKVIELNRLCVNEGLVKNSLSWFVSKSIKLMSKTLVLVFYFICSYYYIGYYY